MGLRRRARKSQHKATCTEVCEQLPGQADSPAVITLQPSRGAGRCASGLKPHAGEVLAAIESLYVDQLKPFGRILRKRLAERAAPEVAVSQQRAGSKASSRAGSKASSASSEEAAARVKALAGAPALLPDIDVKHLKMVCEACSELKVEPEEGGDWSAVFPGREDEFVDIYSSIDPYPEAFWAQASAYFGVLGKDEMQLPGGRYSCAQMLVCKGLPFFANFTLGKVCHFVQLAISKRKVLGYLDGSVVPYAYSQSMIKEQCAVFQQPCMTGTSAGQDGTATHMPVATWDVARACLKEILASVAVVDQGPSTVPLSNVKRLFRSRYNVELSETALGHSKLSELLQDQRFSDVCNVQLQGQGYVVVQNPDAAKADVIPVDEALKQVSCGAAMDGEVAAKRVEFCPDEPLGLEEAGFLTEDWLAQDVQHIVPLPTSTPLQSPGVPPSATVRRWRDEPPRYNLFTEDPQRLNPLEEVLAGASLVLPASPSVPQSSVWPGDEPRRVEFCPGEHLCLEECGIFRDSLPAAGLQWATPLPSPGVPTSTTVRRWPRAWPPQEGPLPTGGAATASSSSGAPTTGAKPLLLVQNTFLHAAPQPPTPLPGSRRRASSLPKDMGTERGALEACQSTAFVHRPCGGCSGDSTADSTGSAGASNRAGAVAPTSPISSSGTSDQPVERLLNATPESTPVKVELNRLESIGSLGGFSEDGGLRTPPRRLFCCPDLSLEEAGIVIGDARPPSRASQHPEQQPVSPSRHQGLTASVLAKDRPGGWVVQNTFIHAAAAPPTPAAGAKCRSRSVPKDVGSETWLGTCTASRRCSIRRSTPEQGVYEGMSLSIDASPAFVPQSPGLIPPTPQTPLCGGSAGGWSFPRARTCQEQRILRLADHL